MNSEKLPNKMPPRLALAHQIVTEAASVALAAFHDRVHIDMRAKAPQDFVSVVDEAVESLIRSRLNHAFPDDAVIGEEGAKDIDAAAEACWFIDPIDGTTNFLRGLPLWGVSIGLVRNGQASIGIVALPALNLIVSAETGSGLFVDGKPAKREVIFDEVRVASIGDSDVDLEESLVLTRVLRQAGWMIESYRCSSLGLAFSALGWLDGHIQQSVRTWDIAGGLALCAEAGLEVEHGPLGLEPTWGMATTPELGAMCRQHWRPHT